MVRYSPGSCGPTDDRILGTVMLVTDLGPIMILLLDPHGLGETGEVLVGWKRGDKIRLPLPPREGFRLSEVSAEEFPSLSKGIAGEFGFTRTTDYREP